MRFAFLRKNLLLKILSVLFAILIWFIVTKEEKSILTLTVPLELKNLPNNLIISNNYPGKIDLRIQGSKSMLADLTLGDVSVSLELSKSQIGKGRYFIRSENVKHPFGTEILLIDPSIIRLDVQKKIEKMIPVLLNVKGKPKKGYQIIGTDANPKEIAVIGPENEIDKIKRIMTEPIDVENKDKTFSAEVPLIILSSHISFLTTEKIKAEIQIGEMNIARKLSNIPVKIIPSDFKIDFNPKTIDVILEGPQSVVNGLDKTKISAEIDISKLDPSPKDYKLSPVIEFGQKKPKTITIKKITPSTVDVRIYSKTK
jgi:YbbR domain-containing protein